MKHLVYILPAVFILAAASESAFADCAQCEREIRAGYYKNKAWPWPDNCPDRMSVRAPFETMVQNGWRRNNLLGPHHFNAQKGCLTRAGELKVHWIVTQAPPQHRQMFVERSLDPTVTSQRIASAQDFAKKIVLDGAVPSVQDTHLIAEGRPAGVVDFINVEFRNNMPIPALPASTLSGSGGDGGN